MAGAVLWLRRLRSNAGPWRTVEAILIAAFALLIVRWHSLINLDCALYLQCAQLLLAGKVPYVDFVDINPPWVMYAMAPVAWAAHALALPVTRAFMVMVGGAVLVSWLELRALLSRSELGLEPHEIGAVAVAWIGASMVIFGFGDLGEREHLFMLAYVPFLVLRLLRHEGTAPGVTGCLLLGLQAGIGACFKPDFVVLALVGEVGVLVARRTWRWKPGPEVAAALGVGAAYLVHWLLVPGAMRAAFFDRWVPAVLRGYDAYSVSYATMLEDVAGGSNVLGLALAALAIGAWIAWRGARTRGLIVSLALLGVASLADDIHQRREWSYHLTPCFMAGILTAALVWIELGRALDGRRALRLVRWDVALAPAVAAAMAAVFCLVLSLRVPYKSRPLADAIAALTTPGERVLVLSTSVDPAYPTLTLLGRLPGSRYLWDFPVAFHQHEIGRLGDSPAARSEEHRFLAELSEDIDRLNPKLIAISGKQPCQGCPEEFHLATYFESAGIVEQILRRYEERPAPPELRLFVRTGS